MNHEPFGGRAWINTLGDVFIGLDSAGVIQDVLGDAGTDVDLPPGQLRGLSWEQFVERYADEAARAGLRWGWQAIMGRHVASRYWPAVLPFKAGWIARLRVVEDDDRVAAAVHLGPNQALTVDSVLEDSLLTVVDRMARLGMHLLSGSAGPLTDMQVTHTRSIMQHARLAQQVLEGLRAEQFLPAVEAPVPQPVAALLGFHEHEFGERRVQTHRLRIVGVWSAEHVYCHVRVREMVERLLRALLLGIVEESTIRMQDAISEDGATVRVTIEYASREPGLCLFEPAGPIEWVVPERLAAASSIQHLISAVHAWLRPVKGRAWGEPLAGDDDGGRVIVELPRWQSGESSA